MPSARNPSERTLAVAGTMPATLDIMMPLAPISALPPICDDGHTAHIPSDRCPQAPETFPDYEVEVDE